MQARCPLGTLWESSGALPWSGTAMVSEPTRGWWSRLGAQLEFGTRLGQQAYASPKS